MSGYMYCLVPLQEHKKAFQEMWLGFLKHKLPLSLYKKVLVAMHDSILPHLAQPTLMIDFLTSACDVGKWDFHLGYVGRATHCVWAKLQLQTVTDCS